MTVSPAEGCSDVHVVDTQLLDMPGVMSAYLVTGEETALIDTGAAPAVEPILDALERTGVGRDGLDYIVPTHVHLDHAGAAGALARECPNAQVLVHERGRPYLTDREKLDRLVDSARRALGEMADRYGDPELVPPDRCQSIADGDQIDLGGRTLSVVRAPGHAPHQVALHDDLDGALFCADAAGMALGGELYPTTPPPDFDLEVSLETLDRLAVLSPSVLCYGHFGVRTDPQEMLETYRSILPEWVDAVATANANHDGDTAAIIADLATDWGMPTLERDAFGVLRSLDR